MMVLLQRSKKQTDFSVFQ